MTYTGEDFNVKVDKTEDPLLPVGKFFATVSSVKLDTAACCVVWQLKLQGNEGHCVQKNSSGLFEPTETSVDTQSVFVRNWLPRLGDKDIMTPSGKSNKWQAKVNMLSDFSDSMKIDMSTPDIIQESCEGLIWVNKKVAIEVKHSEYQGKISNDVKSCKAVA